VGCSSGRNRGPSQVIAAAPAGRGPGSPLHHPYTPAVTKAITSIYAQAWIPLRSPNAIYDADEQRWISDAEVAFTAFTNRRRAEHVTARLIVRRVRRLNPGAAARSEQNELFAIYRYHAVFADSPQPSWRQRLPLATRQHRTSHRRPQRFRAGASALGALHRPHRHRRWHISNFQHSLQLGLLVYGQLHLHIRRYDQSKSRKELRDTR
jgi:hypothetical protein